MSSIIQERDSIGVFMNAPRHVVYRFNALMKANGLTRRAVLIRYMREYTPAMARSAAQEAKGKKGGEKAA